MSLPHRLHFSILDPTELNVCFLISEQKYDFYDYDFYELYDKKKGRVLVIIVVVLFDQLFVLFLFPSMLFIS